MTTKKREELRVGRGLSRVIALDWYDGPILGIASYDADDKSHQYRFALVGGVDYESRIFVLCDVAEREWEGAVALLGEASPLHWPVWVLHIRSGSDEWCTRANHMVQAMQGRADLPVAVIETESIECPTSAVRTLNEDERVLIARMLEESTPHDAWVAFCRSDKSR